MRTFIKWVVEWRRWLWMAVEEAIGTRIANQTLVAIVTAIICTIVTILDVITMPIGILLSLLSNRYSDHIMKLTDVCADEFGCCLTHEEES